MNINALKDRLSDEQSSISLNYPTNLTAISADDFDLLSRHGAEVCEATLTTDSKG
jgi:NTE family protein